MNKWVNTQKMIVRQAAEAAVAEAAQKLAAGAAELTPVRTGRLKAGWQVRSDPGAGSDDRAGGGRGPDSGAAVAYVVNPSPYALAVELGALGRPGRFMAQRAKESLQGDLGRIFISQLNARTPTTRSDDLELESIGQSVEPEEIPGDPPGLGPDRERPGD